jgi:hypothetical protein
VLERRLQLVCHGGVALHHEHSFPDQCGSVEQGGARVASVGLEVFDEVGELAGCAPVAGPVTGGGMGLPEAVEDLALGDNALVDQYVDEHGAHSGMSIEQLGTLIVHRCPPRRDRLQARDQSGGARRGAPNCSVGLPIRMPRFIRMGQPAPAPVLYRYGLCRIEDVFHNFVCGYVSAICVPACRVGRVQRHMA